MKKESGKILDEQFDTWTEKLFDDVFPLVELEPRCPYCSHPIESDKQFCSENCENLYYTEADLYWANKEKEESRREKKEG